MAGARTKIFVGHLPDGCKNEDLQTLFEKYGVVKECDVINKYGFVHMSTPEEAAEAIKNLNNFNLMGSCISVEPSKSKLHPEPGAPGRAKQTFARAGPPRNGFEPSRVAYAGGVSGIGVVGVGMSGGGGGAYSNGYRPAPPYAAVPAAAAAPPPAVGAESYYDRPFGYGGRERMRPYPSPYERRSPTLVAPPMREDYSRRPMHPPPPGTSDPYARPIPPLGGGREDLYERRPPAPAAALGPVGVGGGPERTDYLYSRRSPPPPAVSTMVRPYWYADAVPGVDRIEEPSAF